MAGEKEKVIKLFNELIEKGEEIKSNLKRLYFSGNKKSVNTELYESWRTSCLTLLKSTFSSSSPHYDRFVNLKIFDYYNATQVYLGILTSARDDIAKGYFYHKDLMLSVNIYNSLLNRSVELAKRGELEKSVGILEAVILEILVKILDYKKIPHEEVTTIEELADLLFKKEVIEEDNRNKLREISEFLKDSVIVKLSVDEYLERVKWVQNFLYDYLGSRILILN